MNNRKIKFRIWVKSEGKMYNWYGNQDIILDAIPYDAGDEWTENCELMQFTGLYDQNENEIYEDDIITWENRQMECKIVFKDCQFVCCDLDGSYEERLGLHDPIRIIGNIFENPELCAR